MGAEEPERRVFESQRAGTGVEAPGQPRLSSTEMQQTDVDGFTRADGISELGRIFFVQAVIGIKYEETTS